MGEHEIHVSQKIPGRCHTLATPLTKMRMFKLVSGDLGAPASVCVCVCVWLWKGLESLLCKCILYYVCVYPLGPFRTDGAVQTLR